MNHSDVLEIEYKEQYNQYRWIGQMQAVILTLYGAVSTVAVLSVAALRPQTTSMDFYLRGTAGVLVALGLLGMLVGFGLSRSRTMQRRTAWYLAELLLQMAKDATDAATIGLSALRFRSICSTRGKFKMWDTMNIAILIAFYSAEGFLLLGGCTILCNEAGIAPMNTVLIGLAVLVALVVLTPVMIQGVLMKRETAAMTDEYCTAQKGSLEDMRERLKLPECPKQD